MRKVRGGHVLFLLFIFAAIICSYSSLESAEPACSTLIYEGKGAGEVVFNLRVHEAKKLTCADCHESRGLMPALFEMKRFSNGVTMRKMELGQSCGKCHVVSMNDVSSCSYCHHK